METAVIIPLFNGERWIRRTLESVFAQTLPPREVVVVDDGCQDRSAEIVREFPEARLIRSPQPAARLSRDHGAASSTAPLIAFLDQDDVWAPTHLESLVQILRDHPAAVAASARSRDFQEDGEPWFEVPQTPGSTPCGIWNDFPFGRIQNPSQVLMRRDAFNETGGWHRQTPRVGDVELWHRLELAGDFLCSNSVSVGRRLHPRSFGRTLREQHLDEYLRALHTAAESLARLRSEHHPEEAQRLAQRVNVTARMADMGASLTRSDPAGLMNAAINLETLLGEESDEFRAGTAALVAWFTAPLAQHARKGWMLADLCWELERRQGPARSALAVRIEASMMPWSLWKLARWACSKADLSRWGFVRSLLAGRRRAAKTAALERRLRTNLARWETNVDADGWARRETLIRLPKDWRRSGARLGLELPEWSALDAVTVTVSMSGHATLQHSIKRGRHQLIIPPGAAPADTELALRADLEPFLCGDGRRRSLRIFGCERLSAVSTRHLKIRRWKDGE